MDVYNRLLPDPANSECPFFANLSGLKILTRHFAYKGAEPIEATVKKDGVVKTLHLLRCCKFPIISTYPGTPE